MAPLNQSRSDGRTAYLDGAIERTNLHLATGQTATRLAISDGLGPELPFAPLKRVSGVEVSCLPNYDVGSLKIGMIVS